MGWKKKKKKSCHSSFLKKNHYFYVFAHSRLLVSPSHMTNCGQYIQISVPSQKDLIYISVRRNFYGQAFHTASPLLERELNLMPSGMVGTIDMWTGPYVGVCGGSARQQDPTWRPCVLREKAGSLYFIAITKQISFDFL